MRWRLAVTQRQQRWGNRARNWIFLGVPMGVLAVAGVSKLLDAEGFERHLRGWELIPRASLPYLSIAVPAAELGVAMAWVVWRKATVGVVAVSLYAIFTAIALGHLVFTRPPPCGCFGVVDAYFQHLGEGRNLVIRNAILGGMLIVGVVMEQGGSTRCIEDAHSPSSR